MSVVNYESRTTAQKPVPVMPVSGKSRGKSITLTILALLFVAFQGVRLYWRLNPGPSRAEREAARQQATDRAIRDFSKSYVEQQMRQSSQISERDVDMILAAMRAKDKAATRPASTQPATTRPAANVPATATAD